MKSFFLFFSITLFFTKSVFCGINIESKKDTIHFNKAEVLSEKPIKLDSNWEFYWQEFVNPDEFINKTPSHLISLTSWTNYNDKSQSKLPSTGYATYRLNFEVTLDRPNISLYIPRIIGAYKLWINGNLTLEMGKIGTTKSATLHRRFTKIIPLDSDITDFEIVIQVANFYNKKGGIAEPILLGRTEDLLQKKFLQTMTDMFTIGSFSFIGILFLFFYFIYWNKDKAVLYFSIMCIALAYHTLNDRYAPLAKLFDNVSWILLTKIEYISSYVMGLTASLFFAIILKDFIHKWYTKVVLYYTLLLFISVVLLPAPFFTKIINYFLIFMLVNISYVVVITFKAILAKSKESFLLLIGIVIASSVFLAYIIFFINENETALIYVKFGYIFVFLFIAMLLLRRFAISFRELEKVNLLGILQKREIANQSDELASINVKLKENLKLLEANNEELEDFNHIVSHDLKTPLVSVYSLASFIEEDLKDKIDENTESHIKMMKDVISKMEASINGLLEYSQVAKGNKRKEWFSIHNTLKKVIHLVDTQNKTKVHLPKENIKIYANKLEFEHVFQNLIGNSIKYNDKEKTIITIDVQEQDESYLFSVSDNGPGIPLQYHQQIFKIFNKLETNNNDSSSTGVGLAIVKKIIANNNGKISVKSDEGKGLTIQFTWQKVEEKKD